MYAELIAGVVGLLAILIYLKWYKSHIKKTEVTLPFIAMALREEALQVKQTTGSQIMLESPSLFATVTPRKDAEHYHIWSRLRSGSVTFIFKRGRLTRFISKDVDLTPFMETYRSTIEHIGHKIRVAAYGK